MKDPKKTEIRRILMGKAILGEDGRLTPIPPGVFMPTPVGVGDGAGAVRFLGVMCRIRRYETKDSKSRVMKAARKSMRDIGRGVALNEQPSAAACLLRYILTRPALLVFDYQDGVPTLTAWTGRGLTGWFSLRRAVRAFERGLPEKMTAAEVSSAEQGRKERDEERGRRKTDKEEKKARKAREREEKEKAREQKKKAREREE